jgi:hypothetical protein
VREGKYAARFEVAPGDRPEGLAYGEMVMVYQHIRRPNLEIRERAGQESWWGWSTYFGSDFRPDPHTFWNDFVEFHNTGSGQANMHFELDTTTNPWHFSLRSFGGSQDQNQNRFDLGPFQRNKWLDFIFGVRWATDNSGWIEVWLNGRQVLPRTMIPTIYEGQAVYVMQGFYRDTSAVTTVVYQDAMRRNDTLEQVISP